MHIFEEKVKELLDVKGEIVLEYPPDPEMGDIAFPCFSLAKGKKKNPVEIAKEIASKIKKHAYIDEVKAIGPYVNFFVNKAKLAELVLLDVFKQDEKYGMGKKKKEKIMVE